MILSWRKVYVCALCRERMLTMEEVWDHFFRLHEDVIYTSILMGLGVLTCKAPRVPEEGGLK